MKNRLFTMKDMKSFGLRPNGEMARRIGCIVTSADVVVSKTLHSAIAFFMSFMLFMVKQILSSGRRPVCVFEVLCGKNTIRMPKAYPDIYASLG